MLKDRIATALYYDRALKTGSEDWETEVTTVKDVYLRRATKILNLFKAEVDKLTWEYDNWIHTWARNIEYMPEWEEFRAKIKQLLDLMGE